MKNNWFILIIYIYINSAMQRPNQYIISDTTICIILI